MKPLDSMVIACIATVATSTLTTVGIEAGRPFGIRPYGIKAMTALSIEKSYRLIGRELSIEYAALEFLGDSVPQSFARIVRERRHQGGQGCCRQASPATNRGSRIALNAPCD